MKFVIYGCGGNGLKFYDAISGAGADIEFFIDEYSESKIVKGIPVFRIDEVLGSQFPILVSIGNNNICVAKYLRGKGFENVFDFNESVKKFPRIIQLFLDSTPWARKDQNLWLDRQRVEQFSYRLFDERSKEVLDQIVRFRSTLDANDYIDNDGQRQYFPEDVPVTRGIDALRMVDCGAFDGDTMLSTLDFCRDKVLKIHSISMLEPDPSNILVLDERVRQYASDEFDLLVIPSGAWSVGGVMHFKSAGQSSMLCPGGYDVDASLTIPIIALDDVFFGMQPNFIKMDIEGAEIEALKGAKIIIQHYRPILAICLYHRASDLWEIPSLIDSIYPDYEFYLRVHGNMGLETVLYCLPSENKNG